MRHGRTSVCRILALRPNFLEKWAEVDRHDRRVKVPIDDRAIHARHVKEGETYNDRAISSFMISFVPPKIFCTRASVYMRAMG